MAKKINLNDYLGHSMDCTCGKEHKTNLKIVDIDKDAVSRLPKHIEGGKLHRQDPGDYKGVPDDQRSYRRGQAAVGILSFLAVVYYERLLLSVAVLCAPFLFEAVCIRSQNAGRNGKIR